MLRVSRILTASLSQTYPNTGAVISSFQEIMNNSLNLSLRTREAHWNIKGPFFGPLHELFGEFYDFLDGFVDTLAERIVQLDGTAATSPMATPPMVGDHLRNTFEGAQALAVQVKTAVENVAAQDPASQDILIEFGRELEKWLWKIESHLKSQA